MGRRIGLLVALGTLAAALVGCNGDGTVCADSVVYEEPLVRVVSVIDPASGALVSPVTLTGFRMGDFDYSPKFFLAGPGLINAAVVGDSVFCNVACAFGSTEGTLTFIAKAPGFAPKQVTVDAKYRTVVGSCQKHVSGSTEVRLTLDRP